VIIGVRPVKITNEKNIKTGKAVGAGTGAALGATFGAVAGGKKHGLAAAGVGGLVGLLGGRYIGKKLSEQSGFEYQVQTDDGAIYTIVQGPDVVLTVGQRVMMSLPDDGTAIGRLIPCA
jgi:outer membrane lipoprotein SlyB